MNKIELPIVQKSMKLQIFLGIGYFLLNLFDAILTWYLISSFPTSVIEGNPVMNFVIQYSGWTSFIMVKIVIGLTASTLFVVKYRTYQVARFALWMSFIFYLTLDIRSVYLYLTNLGQL